MSDPIFESMTRRTFLRNTAIGAAGLALAGDARAQVPKTDLYYPFRMAVQSYSLRGYKLDEALAKTQALGLRYWEGWDGHIPVTNDAAKIAEYRGKLRASGIRMPAYGVIGFSADEADARHKFEFAKAMGVRTITASPSPDSFGVLDKLTDEYKINIAIHNHGPGDMYDTWEKVLAAIQGHSERIGGCLDTGHLLRSGEPPEVAADKYGSRLYEVHLKDVKQGPGNEKSFTEVGKGLLDVVIFLKELIRHDYPTRGLLALEYEEHEDSPMPYIQECLKAVAADLHTINHEGLIGK